MKMVSWNVRGLGSVEKRREMRQLVVEKKAFHFMFTRDKVSCL